MPRRFGRLLVLILTALTTGCYDRFTPPSVESATLSIQTVRYGAMPAHTGAAGTAPHPHDLRTQIQLSATGGENTLYMERGQFHAENTNAQIFRLDVQKTTNAEFPRFPARTATQVTVHFGAIAGNLIEIKSGLHEGDQVIVSDMSRFESLKQLHLE